MQGLVSRRTAPNFQETFNFITSLAGLVLYYPQDEAIGNAINYAPATFGTMPGVNTAITYRASGPAGYAYQRNGTTSQTITASNAALNLSGSEITCGLFYNLTNAGGNYRLMQKFGEDYMFNLESDDAGSKKIRWLIKNQAGDTKSVQTNAGTPLGSWCSIIGTYNGANLRSYLNGTLQTETVAEAFTLHGDNGELGVGNTDGGGDKMIGYTQHFWVSSVAMNQTQITQLNQIAGVI